jgi:monoamine oxidase
MNIEVAVIGGGAAGIAAARRLHSAGVNCLIVEARSRLGGRAWTIPGPGGTALDLGCEWLHSGDENPWTEIAEAAGHAVDHSIAPWIRRSVGPNFLPDAQADFQRARNAYYRRLERLARRRKDAPASDALEPDNRWNPLMVAIGTYISGAELSRISAQDLEAYADTGVNWRIPHGYGTVIAGHGAGLPVALDCPVARIEHGGRGVVLDTPRGTIRAARAVVAVPSDLIADGAIAFSPALPEKQEAAAGLPLGLADKLFLSLKNAEEFEPDSRLFGRIDRAGTGNYHFRPYGEPIIEAYFAGTCAAELEKGGEAAFFTFAVEELTGVLGADFAKRVAPLASHQWGADPFARGSYSYALPGKAGCRPILAAPVAEKLFFAGEACSPNDYSTAHGAYRTGIAAAEEILAARKGL